MPVCKLGSTDDPEIRFLGAQFFFGGGGEDWNLDGQVLPLTESIKKIGDWRLLVPY